MKRGKQQLEDRQSSALPGSDAATKEEGAQPPAEPDRKEELVDSEYGGGQDTEPLRPSSTGALTLFTIQIAELQRELRHHKILYCCKVGGVDECRWQDTESPVS